MLCEVGLDGDFNGLRHLVGRDGRLAKIQVEQGPRGLLLARFLAVIPAHLFLGLVGLPERVELLLELLEGNALPTPPGTVPELRMP